MYPEAGNVWVHRAEEMGHREPGEALSWDMRPQGIGVHRTRDFGDLRFRMRCTEPGRKAEPSPLGRRKGSWDL